MVEEFKEIFIGELPPNTTEQELRALLESFGQVLKIDLTKHDSARSPTLTAIAQFKNYTEMLAARRALNGSFLSNRRIKVRLNSILKSTEGDIRVKNLSEKVTGGDLDEYFSQFGTVLGSTVCYDEAGKSLAYAFVKFISRAEAENLVKSAPEGLLDGLRPVIELGVSRSEHSESSLRELSQFKKLYVRGFKAESTESDLKSIFSAYGEIYNVSIMENADISKKYAFVSYATHEMAELALNTLNGQNDPEGNQWFISQPIPKSERAKTMGELHREFSLRNLYIANIPKNIKPELIRKFLEFYGEIESLKIVTEPVHSPETNEVTETPTGVAYVFYRSQVDADTAYKKLSTAVLNGELLVVQRWKPRKFRVPKTAQAAPVMRNPPPHPFVRFLPIPSTMPPQAPESLVDVRALAAKNSENERRQYLGEAIYNALQGLYGQKTSKITGMMLEVNESELIVLLQDKKRLLEKAKEANEVLEKHIAAESKVNEP